MSQLRDSVHTLARTRVLTEPPARPASLQSLATCVHHIMHHRICATLHNANLIHYMHDSDIKFTKQSLMAVNYTEHKLQWPCYLKCACSCDLVEKILLTLHNIFHMNSYTGSSACFHSLLTGQLWAAFEYDGIVRNARFLAIRYLAVKHRSPEYATLVAVGQERSCFPQWTCHSRFQKSQETQKCRLQSSILLKLYRLAKSENCPFTQAQCKHACKWEQSQCKVITVMLGHSGVIQDSADSTQNDWTDSGWDMTNPICHPSTSFGSRFQ